MPGAWRHSFRNSAAPPPILVYRSRTSSSPDVKYVTMRATRRTFLKATILSAAARALGQVTNAAHTIQTPVLTIAYEENGNAQGFPVILLHGFPDDVRAWDDVATPLAKAGYRALAPYLRGYGPTRFRDPAAPRMAEQ